MAAEEPTHGCWSLSDERREVDTMSGGLTVYAVSWENLLTVPGSGADRPILRAGILYAVTHKYHKREGVDLLFADDDPPNTLIDAIAQILGGEKLIEEKGPLYGYAVEAICWSLGIEFCTTVDFPRGCPFPS
jgi:hypothetical protein